MSTDYINTNLPKSRSESPSDLSDRYKYPSNQENEMGIVASKEENGNINETTFFKEQSLEPHLAETTSIFTNLNYCNSISRNLKSKLSQMGVIFGNGIEIPKDEMLDVFKTCRELKDNVEKSSAALEKLLSRNDKITQLQQENAKLKQEMEEKEQSANATIKEWKQQYFNKQTDMIKEQQKLHELESANQDLRKKCEFLTNELNSKENLSNEVEIERLSKKYEFEFQQVLHAHEKQVAELTTELNLKKLEIESLEALQNNKIRNILDLEAYLEEDNSDLNIKLLRVEEQKTFLLDKIRNFEKTMSHCNTTNYKLQQDLSTAQDEFNSLIAEHKNVQQQLSQANSKLLNLDTALLKENTYLRKELAPTKQKLQEAAVAIKKLYSANKEQNTKLEKLEQDNYDLNQTIKNRTETMKNELTELRRKQIEVENKKCEYLDETNCLKRTLVETNQKLIQAEKSIKCLNETKTAQTKAQKKNNEIIAFKNHEIEKMKKEILTLTENMKTKHSSIDELTRTKKSLNTQLTNLSKLNDDLFNTEEKQKREIGNLKQTIANKTSELKASEAKIDSLKNKIAELDSSLNKGNKSQLMPEGWVEKCNKTELEDIIKQAKQAYYRINNLNRENYTEFTDEEVEHNKKLNEVHPGVHNKKQNKFLGIF